MPNPITYEQAVKYAWQQATVAMCTVSIDPTASLYAAICYGQCDGVCQVYDTPDTRAAFHYAWVALDLATQSGTRWLEQAEKELQGEITWH